MKSIYRIISVAAFAVLFASCNLDLIPKGYMVYDENQPAIQKASDLTGFEAGINIYFRSRQLSVYNYVGDLMTDSFNAAAEFGNNYGPVHRTNEDFTAGDQDVESLWGNFYTAINQYNLAINAANTIPDKDLKEAAQVMKGEAFFFRAYSYLYLARYFGKQYDAATAATDESVPLVLVYDQNARPARSTQEKVYAQIKADLDSAAVLLAEVPGAVRSQKPTIDAVKALYARYYLDIKDYENAAKNAQDVIDTGLYILSSTDAEFEAEFLNDNGTEPILQCAASLSEAPNSLDYYTQLRTVDGENCFNPYFFPSGKLVDMYEAGDLRLKNWFMGGGSDSYSIFMSGSKHSNNDVKVFTKFFGNPAYNSDNKRLGQTAPKPFRISEMYLIAAEAYFKNSQPEESLAALNELQSKRGATVTTTPNIEDIYNEWFKETVGEGQRFWCLKRWGQGYAKRYGQTAALSEKLLSTGEYYVDKAWAADDYHFLLPIPNYERKINGNLSQNPGYGLSTK